MDTAPGPVVVAMDGTVHPDAVAAAVELGAREATQRHVDLRLVYGRATLPSWSATWQLLAGALARAGRDHPGLAVTAAVYPGSAGTALSAAADSASLVVLAVPPMAAGPEAIGGVADRAAMVVAMTPNVLREIGAVTQEPVPAG